MHLEEQEMVDISSFGSSINITYSLRLLSKGSHSSDMVSNSALFIWQITFVGLQLYKYSRRICNATSI